MSAPIIEIPGIDGTPPKQFALGRMPSRASFNVRLRLIKMIGEPIFRLFSGDKLRSLVADKAKDGASAGDVDLRGAFDVLFGDPEALGTVIKTLAAQLDPAELESIADVVFASCRLLPSGGAVTFESTFATLPPGAVEKVLFAALKENYRDFFGAAL